MKIKQAFFTVLPVVIILFVSIFLLRAFLFQANFPETHDGQSHVARLANFYLAVLDRHFPFRWAPNLNYKFGYPVFHFNYYTPYLMALVPIKLGLDFETSLKLVFWFSLFMGGFFWYLLLKDRLGKVPGLIAAVFYVAAPYQLVNILIRGSAGEIVGLGVLPILLWTFYQLIQRPSRLTFVINTLAVSVLFVTHNITAVFGTPLLLIYALVLAAEKKAFRKLPLLLLSFGLGIGLTLFFWIPALAEKQYTNMDKLDMSYDFYKHFPTLSQLVHDRWEYGLSLEGPNDGMSFELGPFHWLVALGALLLAGKRLYQKKKVDWLTFFFGAGFILSLFFLNQISLPIWRLIPETRYVQFPWRLIGFGLIGVAFLAGWLTKYLPKIGIGLAIGAVAYSAIVAHPFGGYNWDNYFYFEWPFTSGIKNLSMPIWFNLEKNHRLEVGKVFTLEGEAKNQVQEWRTQRHRYQVTVESDQATILERTAYFPGWIVKVDGQPVDLNYEREDYPGVITYQLSKGEHQVETDLTEQTPARQFGDKLSIIIGIIFLGTLTQSWLFKYGKKRR